VLTCTFMRARKSALRVEGVLRASPAHLRGLGEGAALVDWKIGRLEDYGLVVNIERDLIRRTHIGMLHHTSCWLIERQPTRP
jgi:hypothetical protein